jgi:hypothetical protein
MTALPSTLLMMLLLFGRSCGGRRGLGGHNRHGFFVGRIDFAKSFTGQLLFFWRGIRTAIGMVQFGQVFVPLFNFVNRWHTNSTRSSTRRQA